MDSLKPCSPWSGIGPYAHGAGVTISLLPPHAMASLAARRGALPALQQAALARWGVELPLTPRRIAVPADNISLLWMGPERWLIIDPSAKPLTPRLTPLFGAAASLTEQGDGRVLIRIEGPQARDALAKILPIDLHPRAFALDQTAITQAGGHAGPIGVQIWRRDASAGFEIAVARSLAAELLHWLEESAAAFGATLQCLSSQDVPLP